MKIPPLQIVGDPPPKPPRSLAAMCAVALFFILIAPFFWSHVHLSPGPSPSPDEYLYKTVYPRMAYLRTCVTGGDFPSWNSRQLCGAEFAADPANGVLQPLNLPFLLMSTEKAMAVQSFLCLTLMGIFMAGFLRAIGLGYVAAAFGAVCYAFCGASAAAVTRPELGAALVWLPGSFYCVRMLSPRLGERQRFMVLAPVPLCFMLLSGASSLAVAGLVFVAAYAMFHVVLSDSGQSAAALPKRAALLAVVFGSALLLAAVQWLPTYTWLKTLEDPAAALWNEHLYDNVPTGLREFAAQLLVAHTDSAPRFAYIGITALLPVAAAFFHRRAWREVLAFGGLLGAGGVALYLRPPMSDPYPWAACMYLAIFGVAVLSAIGLDRLLMPRKGVAPESVIVPALAVLIASFAVFHIATAQTRGRIVVSVLLVMAIVVMRWRTASLIGGFLLILVLYTDLHTASLSRYRHPIQDAPQCYASRNDTLMRAKEQSMDGRLLVFPAREDVSMPENLGMIFRMDCAGGHGIAKTRDFLRFWNAVGLESGGDVKKEGDTHPWLLNLMAVKVILSSESLPLTESPHEEAALAARSLDVHANRLWDGTYCYLNAGAFPTAWVTPKWRRVAGSEASLEQMLDESFDPANECIVDSTLGAAQLPDPSPSVIANTAPLRCSVAPLRNFGSRVETEATYPGVLVLAHAYSGGKALLDNVEVPLLRVNSIFQGVYVPEGKHVVEIHPANGSLLARLLPVWVILLAVYGVSVGAWLFGSPRNTRRTGTRG